MLETIIIIKGELDSGWSSWFDDLSIEELPSGDTVLRGSLPDQAAVYGVLSRLSSLGVHLIKCECREGTKPRYPSPKK